MCIIVSVIILYSFTSIMAEEITIANILTQIFSINIYILAPFSRIVEQIVSERIVKAMCHNVLFFFFIGSSYRATTDTNI